MNELINSCIGEFHTITVGKSCVTCGTWLEYRQPIRQSSGRSNSNTKEIEKHPCGEEIEDQKSVSRRDHQ